MTAKYLIEYKNELGRPLILDGAIGSLLQMEGESYHSALWSSYYNITASERVIELHKNYISSGADIITTNTFRTNPATFEKANLKVSNQEFVKRSVELAKTAIQGTKNKFVAGSNPPAEDSYQKRRILNQKQLELNHKSHIDMLFDSGVDFVLNETQSHFDEIKIITEYCSKNNLPYIVSLFISSDLTILSGESLIKVFEFISEHSPIAVGINCIYPEIFIKLLDKKNFTQRWGYYLNCGSGNYNDFNINEGVSPQEYIGILKQSESKNPFFVGTCCGSNPNHTKVIKGYYDE
ncbi:MAG: homocysteine S-methyltransferase family protein [Bacteroidota bacterium]